MKDNLRPGVYARCERESAACGDENAMAALFMACGEAEPGSYILTELYGGEEDLTPREKSAAELLLRGGAGRVLLARYKEGENPFARIAGIKDKIFACVCDETVPEGFISPWLYSLTEEGRGGFALTGRAAAREAAELARGLAHERALVCGPGVRLAEDSGCDPLFAACAMAGAVLSSRHPLTRFSGMEFPALKGAQLLPEEEIQSLLRAGVCVFEEACGSVRLIRGLTAAADQGMRELGATLGADYVLARIKGCLEKRLRDGVTAPQSIKDQATAELMALREEGILSDFDPPRCQAEPQDPSTCAVGLGFTLARLIGRIHITARIRA
ncbi:MAG: hypothetical protein LBU86_06175 [Oscillospiraceae bacterium]|jgi:hypothetical protein|nr:hypothetical protein [Oscillospiraceae bacterium]